MQNPRTPETQAAYDAFVKDQLSQKDQFDFSHETIISEYEHWLIIKNRFPYDTMVRVNDMLVSRRAVSTFRELNEAELNEYEEILNELSDRGSYDARIENFPKVQSVTKHVHVHLVCWHNTASEQ